MKDVVETAVIQRPLEEVFAYVANPINDPEWSSAVEGARQTSLGTLGAGTTFDQVLRLLGRRLEASFEVVEYEPNRRLVIRPTSGPARGTGTGRRLFEAVDGGTRVTFRAEGRLGLFHGLLEPLVAWGSRRQFRIGLATLKDLLEGAGGKGGQGA